MILSIIKFINNRINFYLFKYLFQNKLESFTYNKFEIIFILNNIVIGRKIKINFKIISLNIGINNLI